MAMDAGGKSVFLAATQASRLVLYIFFTLVVLRLFILPQWKE